MRFSRPFRGAMCYFGDAGEARLMSFWLTWRCGGLVCGICLQWTPIKLPSMSSTSQWRLACSLTKPRYIQILYQPCFYFVCIGFFTTILITLLMHIAVNSKAAWSMLRLSCTVRPAATCILTVLVENITFIGLCADISSAKHLAFLWICARRHGCMRLGVPRTPQP